MPAMCGPGIFDGNRDQTLIDPQMVQIEQPPAGAEPGVSLLQGHDIRPDFGYHGGGPHQITAAVTPDPLVDIVGGYPKVPVRGHSTGPTTASALFQSRVRQDQFRTVSCVTGRLSAR